jgi:mycobactin peptide synthetase MbtE
MIFQHELLRSLKANSGRTALEYAGNAVTYQDLLLFSDKITAFLLKEGLQKEMVVGLQLKSKTDLIAAIIGVLNAGGVFVLIDDAWPPERIAAIITSTGLQYLISSTAVSSVNIVAGKYEVRRVQIADIRAQDTAVVQYPVFEEDDSIYIYFTSGSTGGPKGIVGKNCSLLQFLQWEIATFEINDTTRVSQFISPYFDAFLRDVFAPLLAGGTLCIPPEEADFFRPEKIIPWIDQAAINLIHCVPTLFRVINHPTLSPAHFKALKYVLLSGERIIPAELQHWYPVFGTRIQLVNLYGLTETTMIKSWYKITPEDAGADKIPIGEPIWDTKLLVARDNLTPCPPLIPGELYIISAYTAKGYLNAPELTRERFIKLTTDPADKRIAFKTGDKARVLADGRIVLMGREDRQIKLRGIRIEPEEIENVLIQSELVKSAIVLLHTVTPGMPDLLNAKPANVSENMTEGNGLLVAFIIRKTDPPQTTDLVNQLYSHLAGFLPDYMIPYIVEVKEYPLLSSGKVNVKELLNSLSAREITAPEDETEERLLEVWKRILGDKPISTTDSFHRIGGDSLSMMSLIGKIQGEFDIRISLQELFNNMTIRQQAQLIRRSGKDQLFVITPTTKRAAYEVSAAQERIYYSYEVNKKSTAYNISMAFRIHGPVDKDNITRALRELIARHESLRTAFMFSTDRLVQIIAKEVDFELTEIHCREEDVQDAIASLIRPFDLGKAPLIRGGLLFTAEGKTILVVDIHHIVCDGTSQMNLYADFLRLYQGEQLPPLLLQYKDFATWERQLKTTKEYIDQRAYWLSKFSGEIPKLNFPIIQAAVNNLSDAGGVATFEIAARSLYPVMELLGDEEITTFSAIFGAFFIYLSQLTGQTDMVVGMATSGRMQQELDDVVGMFVKALPIRFQVDANMLFKDFVKAMHTHLIAANSNQFYDLSDLSEELSDNGTGTFNGLFDVLFDFQNFQRKAVEAEEVQFSWFDFNTNTTKYPMTFLCSKEEDQLNFRLEYMTQYFTPSDIQMIITQFKYLVQVISENADARIADLIDSNTPGKIVADNITFNFS